MEKRNEFTNEIIRSYPELKEFLDVINYQDRLEKSLVGLSLPDQRLQGVYSIGDNAGSYTDGESVHIGFNRWFIGVPQTRAMSLEMALRLHEVFHVYYTDFKLYAKFIEFVQNDFSQDYRGTENYEKVRAIGRNIAQSIGNGTEDGRIEFKGAFDAPVFRVVGKGLRSIWWESQPLDVHQPTNELMNFLAAIITYSTMRILPKNFYDYGTHRIFDEFEKVKTLVERASRANTAQLHQKMCIEIYKVAKPYMLQLIEENEQDLPSSEPDFSNTSAKKEKSEAGEESEENDGSSDSKDNQKDEKANGSSNDGSDDTSNADSNDELSAEEDLKKVKEMLEDLLTEERENIAKELDRAFRKFRVESKKYEKEDNLNQKETEEIVNEYQANGGEVSSIEYIHPTRHLFENHPLPSQIKKEGKKLERFFASVLEKRKKRTRKNIERGTLNTRQLTRLKTGRRDVFKNVKRASLTKSVGYLLIDGSGSMMGNKQETAMQSAAIVELGLKSLLPLKIAQYTTGYTSVIHKNIKDFDDPLRKDFIWSLKQSYLVPSYANADGLSLRIAIEELKKRPENDRILTIISDGLPTMYHSTEHALNDVKHTIEQAKKDGIKVVAIFIGSPEDLKNYRSQFEYMYGDSSVFSTPEDLTKNISKTYKRFIR